MQSWKYLKLEDTGAHITTLSRALRDPLDSTRDSAEGYAAWVEKRPPRFTGT